MRQKYALGETQVVSAPGAAELRAAVARVQRELAAYRPALPDRAVAEDELAVLARLAAQPAPAAIRDAEAVRHSLLLVAAALGSVSALTEPLAELHETVERATPTC
ncbi:DUF5955 family protein [Streptomyces sp. NPDC088197]|uniref:DUF5955 family protein n=1 Tax=unclassified Streptomyces TaxID=2593676 RepID=UPI0033BC2222